MTANRINIQLRLPADFGNRSSGCLAFPARPPTPVKPDDGANHQDNTGAARHAGDAAIQMQDAPADEYLGPVVIAAADQGQFLDAGVGHVARDVEQVLAQPDHGGGHAGEVGEATKVPGGREREHKLKERAAIDGRPLAEDAHQGMAGLVQRQIRTVENGNPGFFSEPMEAKTDESKAEDGEQPAR